MTVTIVSRRPDPKVIKGKWLRQQVDDLLAEPKLDRHRLTTLINIERQFGAVDLDYLLQLRAWHDGKRLRKVHDHRLPNKRTRTYDVE
jgi:hypothetical protein